MEFGRVPEAELNSIDFSLPQEPAFNKQVLKGKGSVRLNFRDIFAGNTFKGYSKYGNVDAQFTNINDSRAVGLSFTWRFNKGKLKASSGKREGGASDEQERVKTGN